MEPVTTSLLDATMLARIQFAANITFHILFPSITIGLAWVLLFFKLRFVATQDEWWMRAYRLWVKVFALSFAMGVVSGITMSFQFGTNWPGFMQKVGNIAGPLLAYEVLTAFFLEATFLAIMLFGRARVGENMHTFATFLVAAGTTLSAFWILVLNSWMQTPAGFEIRDGVAHATSWLEIIFNPSMPYRMAHMLIASGLTCAFLIAGLSAYQMLKKPKTDTAAKTFRFAVLLGAVLIPLQIWVGDLHGLNTLEHQPQKVAAMEANWETGPNKPLILFAHPNETLRENQYEISIPNGASWVLKHSADGIVPGLNDYIGNHPPVAPVFWGFRIMVGTGLLMLALSWLGAWYIWRQQTFPKLYLKAMVAMAFSGWLATLAGWYTTEIGRQPWLVTGVLKTHDAVAAIPSPMLGLSLTLYLALYAFLIFAYISVLFYLARTAEKPTQLNLLTSN
ncbi:MAG: cytochrome ubiquinol oxidase subunit I [Proteobacteria bacterium]|nr:cytochrome ubiquinol oxidase subunit I [Pseudomonadota bacterium]